MAGKRTVAQLAERKAELTEELREIDAEIAQRAGEHDEPQTPAKAAVAKAPAKSAAPAKH